MTWKKFILTTTSNFFLLKPPSSLENSPELNSFLDDGNEFVLSVYKNENEIYLCKRISINTLYQAVKQVFAPVLLKNELWRAAFDPKLADLLSELEQAWAH
ncbi:hypothetical protein WMY93_029459 [Mugilogobius chulae]|uniref:Uncharacterized protein n=1 Tax=Mugilogobius chulae TaxID=88201 RepID=A0AAW0MUL2_9GOBI